MKTADFKPVRLSIIVPCYKVEKYLERCLDSLLGQTLDGVEIVCINDGSPDRCLRMLKDYAGRYPDRILVIDKANEGVWKARRDGIKAASGEYIGFVDPDDYVHRDFARKLYETAGLHNADIACCGFERIDMDTGHVYSTEMTGFKYASFDIRRDPGLMLEVNAALWNKIFRADVIKRMYDIDHIPRVLDDMMFAQLIYINAGVIAFVNEPLVHYMVRRDSIISGLGKEAIPGVYEAMREVKSVYKLNAPSMLPYIDGIAFLHLGISMMHRLSSDKRTDLKRAIEDNTAFLDEVFPMWRRNPYIRLSYTMRHRGANLKLYLVRIMYNFRLFRAFLAVYGFMIKRLGIDIKW